LNQERPRFPYWHVDAFSSQTFGGNQAAIIKLDKWLPDGTLQTIASEIMLPATAFLVRDRSDAADWEVRWFSPISEIALCGHASLACGHILLEGGASDRVILATKSAGFLELRRFGSGYEIALPLIATAPASYPDAVALLGREPITIHRNDTRYNIFLYESEAQVRDLTPDFAGLATLGNDQFICTAAGEATDIVSRVFVPGGGANEDSVTGSAHAALAPFWAERLRRKTITAHQASKRGGALTLRLDNKGAEPCVWIGGNCATVVEGEFYLTG
jgi:predicted PhzF superfamily epimerase YddE/YHI9